MISAFKFRHHIATLEKHRYMVYQLKQIYGISVKTIYTSLNLLMFVIHKTLVLSTISLGCGKEVSAGF